LIPNQRLIKESYKFLKKKKKFINYIGNNLFSNSKIKETLQNWQPQKKLRHIIQFTSFIGLLSDQNLLQYIFETSYEEAKISKTVYIHYNKNLKITSTTIENPKVKMKRKKLKY
jgi:hypothetical protein